MAILFDLDGTLVDTCDDLIGSINNLCIELNKPLPEYNLLKANISFGIEKILAVAFKVSDFEFLALPTEEITKLKTRFKQLYKQSNFTSSKLFPGIELLITKIKKQNIKIAVVTNKTAEFALPILDKVGLLTKIDCVVTSDLVLKPKPAPDLVLLAIKNLQVKPEECLFIGDAEQDIIAGNLAGVKTAAALFGYIGDLQVALKWPANYFVYKSTDLLPLINQLLY